MNEDQLRAFIQLQESRAARSDVAAEQALAYDYYLRKPFGNEQDGRSDVISSDVWDVVEGMTPSVVDPFVSSPDVVQFNPTRADDEEQAKQESDYVNKIVTQDNDSFTQFVAWTKAGLLQKNGVVKYWWDMTRRVGIETYRGLTADVLTSMLQDPELTLIKATPNETEDLPLPNYTQPDPNQMQAPPGVPPQSQPQPGQPPQAPPQAMPQAQGVSQQPWQPQNPMMGAMPQAPELTFDVKLRRVSKEGRARYMVVPPEEFLIIGRDPNPQNASFVQHKTRVTLSDLAEMGYDVNDNIGDGDAGDPTMEVQFASRTQGQEYDQYTNSNGNGDPSMREVWLRETYCYVDFDDDGIAELRKVCVVGSTVLENEETEEIPFCAWTPYQQLFQFDGRCPADETIEIQDIKSTMWRQMQDNIYTINNNRVFAGKKVNLDDLMDNQIAGIVRVDGEVVGNQVMSLPVAPLGNIIMPAIEYADAAKEDRTGFTRYNQGTDDLHNDKTLGEVQIVAGASNKRTGLVIRSLAEQGVKPLMLGIHGLLRRHATKAETVRLRGKWVTIDPREWKLRSDMTVSVGLGTIDKQQELGTQNQILKMQAGLAPAGIVTPENQFNAAAKFVELAGEKNANKYFTHPDAMPQKAPPDPMQDPKVMLDVAGHKLAEQKFIKESAQKDRELDQVDRELDQVDQKQGIEAQNAQMDALHRYHEAQMKTEQHQAGLAQDAHGAALEANDQALAAHQQGHDQAMDVHNANVAQQQVEAQAKAAQAPTASAPPPPSTGA